MKRIAVFCGSSLGTNEVYKKQAHLVGQTLAEMDMGMVYGGAKIGLMGVAADAALAHGGEVIGVLPHFIGGKEVAHEGLSELHLVDTMHERKMKMNEFADAFIALPGGFGTMEEFFEILTWAQLGLHKKPAALLNVNNFYDHLQVQMQAMVSQGFLKGENYDMVLIDDDIHRLLQKIKDYDPPESTIQWLTEDKV